MNKKIANKEVEIDPFDDKLFSKEPEIPLGQMIEAKLGKSGVMLLQLAGCSGLAYWVFGESQELGLTLLVLAAVTAGVMLKAVWSVIKSAAIGAGRLIAKGVIAFMNHRIGMAMVTGAVICKAKSRYSIGGK